MPSRFLTSSSAASSLRAFLDQDPSALSQFPKDARRELLRLARGVGKGLPTDVSAEIVSEMWVLLLSGRAPAFDPAKGTAKAYLRQQMWNAAKPVRANHTPPGNPTRVRDPDKTEEIPSVVTGLDRALEVADPSATVVRMDAYLDARRIIASASPVVRDALTLIHVEGYGVQEAADVLALSRFQVKRVVDSFVATLAA